MFEKTGLDCPGGVDWLVPAMGLSSLIGASAVGVFMTLRGFAETHTYTRKEGPYLYIDRPMSLLADLCAMEDVEAFKDALEILDQIGWIYLHDVDGPEKPEAILMTVDRVFLADKWYAANKQKILDWLEEVGAFPESQWKDDEDYPSTSAIDAANHVAWFPEAYVAEIDYVARAAFLETLLFPEEESGLTTDETGA